MDSRPDAPGRGPRALAIGVFDLFHVGHLRYLQHARSRAGHLSVAVTPDAVCAEVKGRCPVIPEDQRLELVRGLGWVDFSALQPCSTEHAEEAAEWIAAWRIERVVAGGGWSGSPRWARLMPKLVARGIEVEFAPHTEGVSTTELIAQIAERGVR